MTIYHANKQAISESVNHAQVLGKTEDHLAYITERIAIHKDMVHAYKALAHAASKDGIELVIASGFRSFERQSLLWNNKFSGKTAIKDSDGNTLDTRDFPPLKLIHSILLYSALPGASRHHWGSDIDVYAPNLLDDGYQLQLEPWEYSAQGPLGKLSLWLTEHAHTYGFYLPYNTYQGGVAYEPWHLSYAPLAHQYQSMLTCDTLADALQQSNVLGKEDIIENLAEITKRYITNVNNIPSKLNCL